MAIDGKALPVRGNLKAGDAVAALTILRLK